jgi:hypothetical protein
MSYNELCQVSVHSCAGVHTAPRLAPVRSSFLSFFLCPRAAPRRCAPARGRLLPLARAVCAPAPCTTSAPPRARQAGAPHCAALQTKIALAHRWGSWVVAVQLRLRCTPYVCVCDDNTPRAPPRHAARGLGVQGLIRFLVHWQRLCAALPTSQQALSVRHGSLRLVTASYPRADHARFSAASPGASRSTMTAARSSMAGGAPGACSPSAAGLGVGVTRRTGARAENGFRRHARVKLLFSLGITNTG